MTAALEVLLADRLSPRRLAKAVRNSIFVAVLCENKRLGTADAVNALSTYFSSSVVTAAEAVVLKES